MTVAITNQKKLIFTLVKEEGPHDVMSFLEMLEALNEVQGESAWALAIRHTLDNKGSMDELISQMAQQSQDDPIVMSNSIGSELTVSLLRTLLK